MTCFDNESSVTEAASLPDCVKERFAVEYTYEARHTFNGDASQKTKFTLECRTDGPLEQESTIRTSLRHEKK